MLLCGRPFEKFPIKFGEFCSSPLVLCFGMGTLVSARAASSRIWYESITRPRASVESPDDPSPASADDAKGTAAAATALGIPVRNSLLVAELSPAIAWPRTGSRVLTINLPRHQQLTVFGFPRSISLTQQNSSTTGPRNLLLSRWRSRSSTVLKSTEPYLP